MGLCVRARALVALLGRDTGPVKSTGAKLAFARFRFGCGHTSLDLSASGLQRVRKLRDRRRLTMQAV